VAEHCLSPAARGDLEDIFDYTVQQWGLDQALRYTQLIERACAALACGDMPAWMHLDTCNGLA
jgi:toxin ParE1/3/4